MKLDIDIQQMSVLEKRLLFMREEAIPLASHFAINRIAFRAMEKAQMNIKKEMNIKNKGFPKAVVYVKTKNKKDVDKQVSYYGALNQDKNQRGNVNESKSRGKILAKQEEGFVENKSSRAKAGIPIPTARASGEPRGKIPREKTVRSANKFPIQGLKTKKYSGSRRQQNAIKIAEAKRSSQKYVYMNLSSGKKGIFRIAGGKKSTKVDMIYDLSGDSYRVNKHEWKRPTDEYIGTKITGTYVQELQKQIDRINGIK